jgi:hypothetical protein
MAAAGSLIRPLGAWPSSPVLMRLLRPPLRHTAVTFTAVANCRAMSGVPAKRPATYEDLVKVPAHLVAEIIDGDLVTSPRPSAHHAAPRHRSAPICIPFSAGTEEEAPEAGSFSTSPSCISLARRWYRISPAGAENACPRSLMWRISSLRPTGFAKCCHPRPRPSIARARRTTMLRPAWHTFGSSTRGSRPWRSIAWMAAPGGSSPASRET